MTAEDMHLFGLRVDCSYESKVQISGMNMKETCAEFYKRMYNITRLLIREVGGARGGTGDNHCVVKYVRTYVLHV